jgi:transcription antitermination factor NusG
MEVDITKHLEQMLGEPVGVPVLPPPTSTEWCMVLVQPGAERLCRDSLRRRGIGTWWPNHEREIIRKDPITGKRFKKTVLVPVLPGILFCPWRPSELFWKALDLAPGANNVMRKFNSEVTFLTDLDIVLIYKIEQGLSRKDPPKVNHGYAIGDVVRLVDDEMRRFGSGPVTECSRDGRLKVDINMFGRVTPFFVSSWQVEPIETGDTNHIRVKSSDARDRPAKSPRRR